MEKQYKPSNPPGSPHASHLGEKLIIILGPTAVGKTQLSLEIAKKFGGEIISGDSMQVYRHMNIGTAKLPLEERQGIPHYLLDILEPHEGYSVAQFQSQAKALISEINSRRKIPLIVGGTGLYISSVIRPYYFTSGGGGNEEFRRLKLAEFAKDRGKSLHQELAAIDPEAAARIHPHDSRRLIRALEVYHQEGRPISSYQQEKPPQPDYRLALIGLTMEREKLYARIEERVDAMLEEGLVDEVRNLLEAGYQRELFSMQGLGYRQIAGYLAEETTLKEAVEEMKTATRRFAKRQMTWFKRMEGIHWFDKGYYPDEEELFGAVADRIRQAIGED